MFYQGVNAGIGDPPRGDTNTGRRAENISIPKYLWLLAVHFDTVNREWLYYGAEDYTSGYGSFNSFGNFSSGIFDSVDVALRVRLGELSAASDPMFS